MSILFVKEIPAGTVPLGIRRWGIFPREDGDEGESPPEVGLGMKTIFHPQPRGDSIPENFIKITFIYIYIYIYLSTL
jgi:hypothetical protein